MFIVNYMFSETVLYNKSQCRLTTNWAIIKKKYKFMTLREPLKKKRQRYIFKIWI